jgi:hypothetical protein
MAANEASRLSSESERPQGRPEEQHTPIAVEARASAHELHERATAPEPSKVRELPSEPGVAREQSLEALERAADGIRPSWHGTEIGSRAEPRASTIEAHRTQSELTSSAKTPVALPPPPALPSFESFSLDPRAPQYSADSTVRTAALLPERLAHLLNKPQIVNASYWLRARPWAIWSLAGAAGLLLLLWLWPASQPTANEGGPDSAQAGALHRAPPPLPTPPSSPPPSERAPGTNAQPAASGSSAAGMGNALEGAQPAPAPTTKRRDKRGARAAAKPIAGKAREPRKASKAAAPAR